MDYFVYEIYKDDDTPELRLDGTDNNIIQLSQEKQLTAAMASGLNTIILFYEEYQMSCYYNLTLGSNGKLDIKFRHTCDLNKIDANFEKIGDIRAISGQIFNFTIKSNDSCLPEIKKIVCFGDTDFLILEKLTPDTKVCKL